MWRINKLLVDFYNINDMNIFLNKTNDLIFTM